MHDNLPTADFYEQASSRSSRALVCQTPISHLNIEHSAPNHQPALNSPAIAITLTPDPDPKSCLDNSVPKVRDYAVVSKLSKAGDYVDIVEAGLTLTRGDEVLRDIPTYHPFDRMPLSTLSEGEVRVRIRTSAFTTFTNLKYRGSGYPNLNTLVLI